jgi:hypothetical protein
MGEWEPLLHLGGRVRAYRLDYLNRLLAEAEQEVVE